jgi:hypothetical protein
MKIDDFFRLTGGFRNGETEEQLKERIAEIVALETRLKAGGLETIEIERITQRLRQLKQIDGGALR